MYISESNLSSFEGGHQAVVLVNVWRTLGLRCLDLCSRVIPNRADGRMFFFRKMAVGFEEN